MWTFTINCYILALVRHKSIDRGNKMAIKYKRSILPWLKECGYNTTRLRREKLFGEATIQAFRTGRPVAFSGLDKLCSMLDCKVEDIIEYVPDEEN